MKLSRSEDIYVVDSAGTQTKVVDSTGRLLQKGEVPMNYVETINWSSGGLSVSTSPAYGVTYISMTGTDPSSSPRTLTLGSPIAGVTKSIILDSTAAYINTIDIDLGADVGIDGSTTNRYIAFSTLAEVQQSVNLIGITTALWGVVSVASTVGDWGTPTGIRSASAGRTS